MTASRTSECVESFKTSFSSSKRLPYRILVAEDDTILLRLNAEILMRVGYEVDATEDGQAAWQALNAGSYDLLITDNNMPKVTGVELLKKLCGARISIPVILASGLMPTADLERHPQLQIEATLLKPYTAEKLLETVEEVLHATGGNVRSDCAGAKQSKSSQGPAV